MHAQTLPSLYRQLEALPDGLTGEILNGQLHAHPRPAIRHIRVGSSLGGKVYRGFDEGDGGPGGWWILDEPEVHFVRDTEVTVPDIAGWRQERMPVLPEDQRVEVVPDWVCEILSPSTASKDREIKMPLYARYGVAYAWLVDPDKQTLEVHALERSAWCEQGRFVGNQQVTAVPFEARGKGVPLSTEVRMPMEQAMGQDFGQVQINTDTSSDQLKLVVRGCTAGSVRCRTGAG